MHDSSLAPFLVWCRYVPVLLVYLSAVLWGGYFVVFTAHWMGLTAVCYMYAQDIPSAQKHLAQAVELKSELTERQQRNLVTLNEEIKTWNGRSFIKASIIW